MTENGSGSSSIAAPADTSPAFHEFVAELSGDWLSAEPESDAGTPPAPSSEASPETARSESDATSAPTDTPSVAADGSEAPASTDALDQSTPTSPTDIDPFDGASPLSYTVDGTPKTFDGITVLKDGTAIIENAEAVTHLQRIIGERDHLFAKDQQAYQKYADLERRTTWTTRRQDGTDAQGNPKYIDDTLTGVPALEAQRALTARSLASLATMNTIFTDPNAAAKFVTPIQDEQGNIYLAWNQDAIETLRTRIENAAIKAEGAARQHFASLGTPPQVAASAAVPDASSYAGATIAQLEKDYQIAGLTPEDRQEFADIFDRFVMRDSQGTPISVDPKFPALLQARGKIRAETSKVTSTVTTAANQNAARLAAAGLTRTTPKAPVRETVPADDADTDSFDALWERRQKAASGALRAHTFGR